MHEPEHPRSPDPDRHLGAVRTDELGGGVVGQPGAGSEGDPANGGGAALDWRAVPGRQVAIPLSFAVDLIVFLGNPSTWDADERQQLVADLRRYIHE